MAKEYGEDGSGGGENDDDEDGGIGGERPRKRGRGWRARKGLEAAVEKGELCGLIEYVAKTLSKA